MDAKTLIDDVLAEIVDASDTTRTEVLNRLNSAQLAVAGKVLLPGLADGNASVDTVVDANEADMPLDFHRHVYLSQVAGCSVQLFRSLGLLIQSFGSLGTDAGDVQGVAVKNRKLVYQNVPETSVEIDLAYYRKPVDLEDLSTSFPDGLADSEEYDMCLFHYACWKLFARVEDYTEAKHDTLYHKNEYKDYLVELRRTCSRLTGPETEMPLSGAPRLF